MVNKSKWKVFERCGHQIKIDINNPDPIFRTHCAVCMNPLIPDHQGGCKEIGENAVFGLCYRCSGFDNEGKRVVKTPEEIKEERAAEIKAAREQRITVSRKKVEERTGQILTRPCGCGKKGRHRDSCELSQGYKKPGRKKKGA
jgi:hypothetical protein